MEFVGELFDLGHKLGSLSKASAKLQVSQSTLSRHIKSLEDFLGFALFGHRHAGVIVDTSRVALQARAEAIGGEVDAFFREAVGLNAQVGGTVRVTLAGCRGEVADAVGCALPTGVAADLS